MPVTSRIPGGRVQFGCGAKGQDGEYKSYNHPMDARCPTKGAIHLTITVNGRETEIVAKRDPHSYYTILNMLPGGEPGEEIEIELDNGHRREHGRVHKGNITINGQETSGQIIFVKDYHKSIIGWKQLHDLGLLQADEHRCVITEPPVLIKGDEDHGWIKQPYLNRHLIGDAQRVLNSWVRDGIIEKCDSPCNSPIALGRKQNGKVKIHFDFQALNECSEAESPHIQMNRHKAIAGITLGRYYSVLKLYYGEWQIPLDTNTKYKTAFTFLRQRYVWNRLPGKFTNSLIMLSKTLEKILNRDELPQNLKKHLTFYIDTILMSADTEQECREFTYKLQQHLENNSFRLHGGELQLCQRKVTFLGREVNADGIRLGRSYIETVRTIPPPEDKMDLKSILYQLEDARQFTPGFGVLKSGLSKLLGKDAEWRWGDEQEEALSALIKQVLKNRPVVPRLKDEEPCTVQIYAKDDAWMAEILNSAKKPYRSESGVSKPTKKKKDLAIQELRAMMEVWRKHGDDMEGREVEWEVQSPDLARYKDNPGSVPIIKDKNHRLGFLLAPTNKIKVLPANGRKPPVPWPKSH